MRALTWQGNEHVEVTDVPDPQILEPNDIVIKVTSTAICGSDLHLYGVLGSYLKAGDILGHEAMGIVVEAGPRIRNLGVGDRVVVPFNNSCGYCWMCSRGLFAQCETTQVRAQGKGAALFGYTSLYGSVPGGQAEFMRVPFGDTLDVLSGATVSDTTVGGAGGPTSTTDFSGGAGLPTQSTPTPVTATGAGGSTTALVGSYETVAQALLDYTDIGCDLLSIRGWDPLNDAIDYARYVLPLVRQELARRPEVRVPAGAGG